MKSLDSESVAPLPLDGLRGKKSTPRVQQFASCLILYNAC
jgi:hypothetical protein